MRPTIVFYIFSGVSVGLASLYALLKRSKTSHLRRQLFKQVFRTMGTSEGGGGGFKGFFKRFWSCLTLYVIGTKWGLIELFTRHKALNVKGESLPFATNARTYFTIAKSVHLLCS